MDALVQSGATMRGQAVLLEPAMAKQIATTIAEYSLAETFENRIEEERVTVTDTNERFDANDAKQLKEFDDLLWKKLEAARAYYEQEAGWAEAAVGLFAANHGRLWELVEKHSGLEGEIWLQIVTRSTDRHDRVVVVVHLVDRPRPDRVFEVDGLELIDPMGIGKADR